MNLTTASNCPVCGCQMQFDWVTQELPYFGEALLVSGVCNCGFRHSDTIHLSQKEPMRHILHVADVDDMDARVIRSSSGTIRVPELGVDVEPGHASESYVSNVEGVLDRIEDIVGFATRSAQAAGNLESTKKGQKILENICQARLGQFKFTIVLEDPLGNSAIISEKAICSALTDEEVSRLNTGMLILDA